MEICKLKNCSIKALLVLIVFFPSFFGYTSLGTGQLIYLMFVLLFLLIIYLLNRRTKISSAISPVFITLYLQSFLFLLTLLFNGFHSVPIYRDYFEPFRPVIYAFFFSCPLLLDYDKTDLILFFRKLMLLSVFLDIIKFLPVAFPLLCLYSPFEFNSINYVRFSGSFGFCYNFGFIMLFLFAFSLLEKSTKRSKLLKSLSIALLIFFTGSRSIIAAFFFLLFVYCIVYVKGVHRKLGYIIVFCVGIAFAYLFLKSINVPFVDMIIQYVERLIDAIFGDGGDGSLDTRQGQLDMALSYLNQNVLLGAGPLKGSNEPIEMLIGYYLSSWGILGFMSYVILIFIFLRISFKCSYSSNFAIANFSKANFLWILTIPVVGMSSPITDQVRVFNLFYIIQGLKAVLYIKMSNKINV